MCAFRFDAGTLTCDGVVLSTIAAGVGTPTYVYSAATLGERVRAFTSGLGDYPHAVHYAL